MTKDLIKSIQSKLGVEADGIIGPITRKAIADKLIAIAEKELGIHETSTNHGVGIEKYWTATNYPEGYEDRAPYCAAFISYCFKQSGLFPEDKRPKTAGAFAYENWAINLGISVIKNPDSIKRGDIVIYKFSHIGIATGATDSHGKFSTIEANTSPTDAGSQRDGGGVYRKSRTITTVRSVVRF